MQMQMYCRCKILKQVKQIVFLVLIQFDGSGIFRVHLKMCVDIVIIREIKPVMSIIFIFRTNSLLNKLLTNAILFSLFEFYIHIIYRTLYT